MTRALPTLVEAAFRATDRYVLYVHVYARRDPGKLDFSIAASERARFKAKPVAADCRMLDNLLYIRVKSVSFIIAFSGWGGTVIYEEGFCEGEESLNLSQLGINSRSSRL